MKKKAVKRFLPIFIFAFVFIISVGIAYQMLNKPKRLKIYSPSDLNRELVDTSKRGMSSMHRIADFKLINQFGDTVTGETFKNKIYVADFFFTTCPGICPKMTKQMKRVHEAYQDDPDVMMLSHTVQPEVDSVEKLMKYAREKNVQGKSWLFVTGDKKLIYELARKSYFAATTEGDGGVDDFIHTENFVLVDKKKRIRGFYDGTSHSDVDRLIKEIKMLQEEYESSKDE